MKVILVIVSLLFSAHYSFAAPNEQAGSVEFEEDQEEDTYGSSQEEAIKFFQQMATSVTDGVHQRPLPLGANSINYLTGAYLYCISLRGVCREIPQTIYEADVMTSKLDNKAACPLSLAFWRMWLKNDMEERSKYLLKTSHLHDAEEFTRKVRPAFIQCEKTIGEILQANPTQSPSEFFAARYKADTIEKNSVEGGIRVLQIIKEKVSNVFTATGSAASEMNTKQVPAKKSAKSTTSVKRK